MTQAASYHLALLCDLGGSRPSGPARERPLRLHEIDLDRFERVIGRLSPRIELGLPFCGELEIASLDHFSPDFLVRRIPALSKLLEARDAAGDRERLEALLRESGLDPAAGAPATQAPEPSAAPGPEDFVDNASLLEAILAGDAAPRRAPPLEPGERFVRKLLEEIEIDSMSRSEVERRERAREAIERELAVRLRLVLKHPRFRELEAAWRGLWWLAAQSRSCEGFSLRVADISKAAILSDLDAAAREGRPELLEDVLEELRETPGSTPVTHIVACFELEAGEGDLRVLEHLGGLAERAGAVSIAGAGASLREIDREGSGPAAEVWNRIRQSGAAGRIALAFPRVLLRLPYGPRTARTDLFEFDEGVKGGRSEEYVWGSAALAVARAWTLAAANEDPAGPSRYRRIEGLPVHVFQDVAGDTVSQPPAEMLLRDSEVERAVDLGFVPIVAEKGTDRATVAVLQTLAGTPLA